MPARMPRTASAPLLVLAIFGLVGCAPNPSDGLPPGIEVSVHQNRPDTGDRRLQVRITNGSDAPLTVTELTFSSPRFAEPVSYQKAPSTIRSGGVLDLPIALAAPACDQNNGGPEVLLEFQHSHDGPGTATVVPDDPLDQLDGISERDCLDDAMTEVAEIKEPPRIRSESLGGRLVALVDLEILPSGGAGSFTIHSVDDTVLFGLFSPASAAPLVTLPLDLTVRADGDPRILTIPLVPARCDAHAVAEDKRGTLLPLRVEIGELSGIRYFALSDDRKGELYSYLGEACPER
ncbi:MAG: hypothetical protein WED09_09310 [Homoserinimonas sp.]